MYDRMEGNLRLAILIDGENFSSKYVKQLFDEAADYGYASIRRVYGSVSSPQMAAWKDVSQEYSISSRQEFCYSSHKSAADFVLTIDAMDILHDDAVDGFFIASSDGDFRSLAVRIREAGKKIFGIGESKTPKAFVNSCIDGFVYVDLIAPGEEKPAEEEYPPVLLPEIEPKADEIVPPEEKADETGPVPENEIRDEIIKYANDNIAKGYENHFFLGVIGAYLKKRHPEFDARNYQCKSLAKFIEKFDCFAMDYVANESNPALKTVYISLVPDEKRD